MTAHHVKCRRVRGFSIVELMVAMTLSLILMGGALSILYSSKLTYTENERIARIQEIGRTVIELMLRDVRSAGYDGCTHPTTTPVGQFQNVLATPTNVLRDFATPLGGYEAGASSWTPTLNATDFPSATTGSDVVVIRTSPQGAPVFRTNAPVNPTTADIPVDRPANATLGRMPMIISDCEGSSVFVATSLTAGGTPTTATIQHSTAVVAQSPANATGSLVRSFKVDALVMPLQTISYYVRPSANLTVTNVSTGPALWRKTGEADPLELVPGVENLQVAYGELNPTTNVVTQRRASAVTNWNNIVSMTIAVLVRSENTGGVELDRKTYTLLSGGLGATVGPFTDRRQRSVFATTVVLRNRAT